MALTTRGVGAGVVTATVRAFDRLAPRYDTVCAGSLFEAMRTRVRAVFERSLAPGDRILEIGCGSGLDTAWLTARDHRVIAVDPSAGMIDQARARVAADGRPAAARLLCCDLETVDRHLGPSSRFDAIVSNFGALNCVARLAPLRHLADTRLEPGGRVLVCLMSRACAWEIAWFLVRGQPCRAFRRMRRPPVLVEVEGFPVPTYYHRLRDLARQLEPVLSITRVVGCGVLAPPPYLERRWQRVPATVRAGVRALDAAAARVPPLNRLGDHVLAEFEKRRR